jgi:hypothetical protein
MIGGSNIGPPLCVYLRVYNILSFRLCTQKILPMHIINLLREINKNIFESVF